MIKSLLSIWCFLFPFVFAAQGQKDNEYAFGLLRQSDDVTFLSIKKNKIWYDNLKYISFGDSTYLSLGGSLRGQLEHFTNQGFQDRNTDAWWLNRVLVHADLRIDDNWQFFAELGSSTVWSKAMPSPVDKDELYVNQLFLSYQGNHLKVVMGRENPDYGARRIIAFREGPNVRRFFDNIRVIWDDNQWKFEAFYVQPAIINPNVLDNHVLSGKEHFYGTYNSWNSKGKNFNLDYYYVIQERDQSSYQFGTAEEIRYSLGLRGSGSVGKLNYDLEGIYQFGDFGKASISAWTASVKLNYIIENDNESFDFGLKTEIISGDNSNSENRLETFNALYPRGAYFGRVAQFGPSNLVDFHPSFTYSVGKWFFNLDYVAFWRHSEDDGVYGAGLNLNFEDVNDKKFIGHQYGAVINWQVNKFFVLEVEANYIESGSFLTENGLGADLFHFVFTSEFKF